MDEAARLLGSPQRIVESARWFSQANPHGTGHTVAIAALVGSYLCVATKNIPEVASRWETASSW